MQTATEQADEQIVVAENLTVRFGKFTAVNDVSFSVDRGEIFGFLGANGAGKTTTIRVLCGLLPPTEGTVRVCGHDYKHGVHALKKCVGYMSQKFTLYDDLTVGENLEFTGSLRKIDPEDLRSRQAELLEFIEFKKPLKTMVRDLPGGIKQHVALVAALLGHPQIVFLDEPTAGVTPAARARFWSIIRRLAAGGTTVFVTTHYMDEAEQCTRVALMRNGELIALDSPTDLKSKTFPAGLLELTPKVDIQSQFLEELRANAAFDLFEPHGLRWHAAVSNEMEWKRLEPNLREDFEIRPIGPSLEDVFIRLVEGKPR